jgi:hypothetical protein
MAEPKEKQPLTRKQESALEALLVQPTINLAAAQAKVGERTLGRWLAEDEAFKAEYLRMRREIVNNAIFQIQKATNNAVNVTIALMNDTNILASTRLGAARTILEMAIEAVKIEALEERLQALEAHMEQLGIKNHTNGKGHGYASY